MFHLNAKADHDAPGRSCDTGPTESVAWGAFVERIQQAQAYYVAQLFRAVEAKDPEEAGRCAVTPDKFWRNLNWLAQAHGKPQSQAQLIAKAQARTSSRPRRSKMTKPFDACWSKT